MSYRLKKINIVFHILACFFTISMTNAQDFSGSINIVYLDNDENSWWIQNNNFGLEFYSPYQKTKFEIKKTNFEVKFNISSSLNNFNRVVVNESYVKIPIKNSFIKLGRYYRDFSMYLNDELSSGSLLISNNAQAMPKIGIVSQKKIKRNQNITFDFGIAHGIFDKNTVYTSSPFLHEKFIYMNIKNNNTQYSFGFVHEAIWGGEINSKHRFAGKQPNSISDFLKVFISADGPSDFPHANALGNHLGVWDFSIQKGFGSKSFKTYYQHIFEDTSGLRFKNKTDGLWGIEFKNYIKNTTLLLEYLNTKNQFLDPPYVAENYYSHGLYSHGWSYKNNTIGNPLIKHGNSIASDYLHLGFNGSIKQKTFFRLSSFRELSKSDFLKYKLEIKQSLKKNYLIGITIFKDLETNFGIEFEKKL